MIKMPWTNWTLPNAMIEVADACNVRCDVCYHRAAPRIKPLAEIRKDLENAMRLRRLHTVTISGGEPTLHPELCEVVRMIKTKGFHVFLLTNGLLLDRGALSRLKEAGLDSVLFHVDLGQRRPDLPSNPSFADVEKRLNELVGAAASHAIDVSVSTTLYEWAQLEDIARYFMDHPDITFLSLSRAVDCVSFFENRPSASDREGGGIETPGITRFIDYFREHHALEPFSYIPTLNGKKTVWISYFVPVYYHRNGYTTLTYRSTWIDVATMRLGRLLSGHYVHKTTQNPPLTWARIVLNAASRLRPGPAARFWMGSRRHGGPLRHKMIVYDDGPFWSRQDGVQHCSCCPAAVVRNGTMVPCCTADYAPENVHRATAS